MVKIHKIILAFILILLGLGYSQGRKVETDTLKARAAFKIKLSGTWYDRSSFFGYLNGSNQLGLSGIADNSINSAKIVDASIANADIVDPWVGITAGNGLWSSSTTLNLGQLITMRINVDGSTIDIVDDNLTVVGGAGANIDTLADSTALKAYSGKAAYMQQLNSSNARVGSGLFIRKYGPYTADEGIFFDATGGDYWYRLAHEGKEVSPEWWGLSPNSSASVNVSALQSAIDKATGGGADSAVVEIGGYGSPIRLDETITINSGGQHDGITIRGMPGTILDMVADDTLFNIIGFVSTIKFENIQFRGNGASGGAIAVCHDDGSTGSNYIFRDCHFDTFAVAIDLEDVTNLKIENCNFTNGGNQVLAGFNADAWVIDNSIFFNNDSAIIVHGSSADNLTVRNSTFGYNTIDYVHTGGGGFTLQDNYFEGSEEYGKIGTGSSGLRNINIIGNAFQTQGITTAGFTFLDFDIVNIQGIKETGNLGPGILFDFQHVSASVNIENCYAADSVRFRGDNDYRYNILGKSIKYQSHNVQIQNANNFPANKHNKPLWEKRFYTSNDQYIETWRKTGTTNNTTTFHLGLKDLGGGSGYFYSTGNGAFVSGDSSINSSASFEGAGTNKGILPNRVTTTQRGFISSSGAFDSTDSKGLHVFNTSTNKPNFWDGNEWKVYATETGVSDTLTLSFTSDQINYPLATSAINKAERDTISDTNFDRIVWLFDDSQDEFLQVYFNTGAHRLSGTTWYAEISWYSPTATSGAVSWGCQAGSFEPGGSLSLSVGTTQYTSTTTAGSTNTLNKTRITFTVPNEPDAFIVVRFRRDGDGSSATDDMSGDAYFLGITIKVPLQ